MHELNRLEGSQRSGVRALAAFAAHHCAQKDRSSDINKAAVVVFEVWRLMLRCAIIPIVTGHATACGQDRRCHTAAAWQADPQPGPARRAGCSAGGCPAQCPSHAGGRIVAGAVSVVAVCVCVLVRHVNPITSSLFCFASLRALLSGCGHTVRWTWREMHRQTMQPAHHTHLGVGTLCIHGLRVLVFLIALRLLGVRPKIILHVAPSWLRRYKTHPPLCPARKPARWALQRAGGRPHCTPWQRSRPCPIRCRSVCVAQTNERT